jgi:hypothetical protein
LIKLAKGKQSGILTSVLVKLLNLNKCTNFQNAKEAKDGSGI